MWSEYKGLKYEQKKKRVKVGWHHSVSLPFTDALSLFMMNGTIRLIVLRQRGNCPTFGGLQVGLSPLFLLLSSLDQVFHRVPEPLQHISEVGGGFGGVAALQHIIKNTFTLFL